MDYIELKYSRLVSSYLTGWKDVGNSIYRFRCPFCGDSKKSSSKTRGYFYETGGKCKFKCHNCAASMGLGKFLGEVSPALAKEYRFERFTNSRPAEPEPVSYATTTQAVFGSRTLLDRFCTPLSELDDNHKAKTYIIGRKIPDEYMSALYYTENVVDIMSEIDEYKESSEKIMKRDAIVIPFFDENKSLMCIQFRFFEGTLRYLTLKVTPDAMKMWGLDRVNWNERVYVCEGAFDAMFLPNCIAVAGASILSVIKYIKDKSRSDFVLIFDKDYRVNYEVYSQFAKAIAAGYKVVIFDQRFQAKDINSQVQDFGHSIPQVIDYIEKHTFSGLMAKLELSKIRPPTKRKYGQETS